MKKYDANTLPDTPLMRQYIRIKKEYPDTLLLFRVGDFYETFGEDAQKLHEVVDIKLTKRSNGSAASVPLAGFPHHALDVYLPKLVQANLRVAVCDQLETPQQGRKVVKRGVTELVTPGLTYHDQLLEQKSNRYLASIHITPQNTGVAFLDISTGEYWVGAGHKRYIDKLIQSFQPAEIIYSKRHRATLPSRFPNHYIFALEDWVYQYDYAYEELTNHFGTHNLKGFGIHELTEGIVAAGAVLYYLKKTEHNKIQHVRRISPIQAEKTMWLDQFTIRHLELIKSQQEGGKPLIQVLDKTLTAMGGRNLKQWLLFPLKKKELIDERLTSVTSLVEQEAIRSRMQQHLRTMSDLARLSSKLAAQRIHPRECIALKNTLLAIEPIKELIKQAATPSLARLLPLLDPCKTLTEQISKTLQEEAPVLLNQGGMIKRSFSSLLDELYAITFEGNTYLQEMQAEERKRTGISSLKIGYNKVFGYYLEVTNTHKNKTPQEWIRKQTLANVERYITEELKKYEEKLLHAQERMIALEQEIYQKLIQSATGFVPALQRNAQALATLDCYQSLSQVAIAFGYTKPTITEEDKIKIKGGRHPVIEYTLPLDKSYVPNDLLLDTKKQQIMLITGPNMGGKSAFLRQSGLITIMAHMGSFVPAEEAIIGITEGIFTRVGASDNITQQESTFMVEMNEMARILNNLGRRTLVIIDELGRGTSTADGTALAQSIIEYLHEHPDYQSKTLFATHYHTLSHLTEQLPRVKNFQVAVSEKGKQVIFLHKLVPGSCHHSFGIHVAQLAGIPLPIIERATAILHKSATSKATSKPIRPSIQLPIFEQQRKENSEIIDALSKIDPLTMTPIEAIMKLQELCHKLPKSPQMR
ncbi:MAG: DNA mismatch repair protein MutS [Bacteroidota bacterium]